MNQPISIIGFGAFGQLLHQILTNLGFSNIIVFETSEEVKKSFKKTISFTDFEQTAQSELVFLAIPFSSLESVLKKISAIKPTTQRTIIDVLSVKKKPAEMMKKILPAEDGIIASHPLFGPQAYFKLDRPQWIIHQISENPWTQEFSKLLVANGFEVIDIDPDQHDQEMAYVHALTFFVGRGLIDMNLQSSEVGTYYYERLLELRDLEKEHSDELFKTIEVANPYAKKVRQDLLKTLSELNNSIESAEDKLDIVV